jgi:hypothetical protein
LSNLGKPLPIAIRYHFSQGFTVSALNAYFWCTDFTPQDLALVGEDNVEREVMRLTDSTVVLKEVFHTNSGDIEKEKLVHFYPDRLSWISTHLTGPNKYSQFIYEISIEDNNSSRLNFSAIHMVHEQEMMIESDIKVLANELCNYDSMVWKLFAKAMEKELNK